MILQLNPTLPVSCPKGNGQALFLIDYSSEHDLYYVIALDDNGEIWTYNNKDVRAQKNITMGRMIKDDKKFDHIREFDLLTFDQVKEAFEWPDVKHNYKARRQCWEDGIYVYWNYIVDALCFVNKKENIGVDDICLFNVGTVGGEKADDWIIWRYLKNPIVF